VRIKKKQIGLYEEVTRMNPTGEKQDVRAWPRHVGESFRLKIVQRLAKVPDDMLYDPV